MLLGRADYLGERHLLFFLRLLSFLSRRLQVQVLLQQGLRHLPASVLQRGQLLERQLSDVEHEEAQHHHHADERAHHGGVGVLVDPGRGAGRGGSHLRVQQVPNVREGAVVRQRAHRQDVAHERVEVDGAHGGFQVILAKGWTASHEHRLHAAEGVVVAMVSHWREGKETRKVCIRKCNALIFIITSFSSFRIPWVTTALFCVKTYGPGR